MLLNLTNHPHDQWSEKQTLEAISKYGHIKDMTFPKIDPSAETRDVLHLALEYLNLVENMIRHAGEGYHAVHLMGEFTFIFALVGMLQQRGIKCCLSTTERQSHELPGGEKVTKFEFVRFREYPVIN